MAKSNHSNRWYPKANPEKKPSPWWYFGRAIYVSRHDYRKIFLAFISVGIPFALLGLFSPWNFFWTAAWVMAALGLALLLYSLLGLYRQYGHPSYSYFEKLLSLGDVEGKVTLADIHIGTYRHTYQLAEVLPEATLYSIDCWEHKGPSPEKAIEDVRALEPPPRGHPQIRALTTNDYRIALDDASCDVVVFGFGTHEIPLEGPREKIFAEAKRILKPSGTVLLFEHGYDFHNYLIFGPVIDHVTKHEEWLEILNENFVQVREARTSHAVDLFAAQKRA